MNIGNRIQQERKKKQLSQEQLAELIFVSRQAVSKWEQGTALPTIDNCQQLCKVFGISMDDLTSTKVDSGDGKKKINWKNIFIIFFLGIMLLLCLGLSVNNTALRKEIDLLNQQLDSCKPVVINQSNQFDESKIESIEIKGIDLDKENEEITLMVTARLKEQTSETRVQFSFLGKSINLQEEAEADEDFSFTSSVRIPLESSVNITLNQIEENQIIHLYSEEYRLKERFVKDFEIYYDVNKNNQLIFPVKLSDWYGAYDYDSLGNPITKMFLEVNVIEDGKIVGEFSFDHSIPQETSSSDGGISEAIGRVMFVQINRAPEELSKDAVISVKLTINDHETIKKEAIFSALKHY